MLRDRRDVAERLRRLARGAGRIRAGRTAAAGQRSASASAREIAPLSSVISGDRPQHRARPRRGDHLDRDEGNRPTPRSTASAGLKKPDDSRWPASKEGRSITRPAMPRNADGALGRGADGGKRGRAAWASATRIYRGIAVAALARRTRWAFRPGPRACRKLLQQHGLKIDDIDLWELTKPSRPGHLCRDALGIRTTGSCRWWGDLDRPSLRHVGRTHGRGMPHDRGKSAAPSSSSARCASAGRMGARRRCSSSSDEHDPSKLECAGGDFQGSGFLIQDAGWGWRPASMARPL